jgi:predicted dehydrogenase
MNLTSEQMDQGRRNFLRVLAGVPAVASLGVAAALRGAVPGGPVRIAFIGVGSRGRTHLADVDPAYAQVRAICDINPSSLDKADEVLRKNSVPPARHYADWKEMLQKEDIEAVVMAPPLWAHADLATGCLEAGKHVLCEKMMAWDEEGCERMRDGAHRNGRILELGYQRNYNPLYRSAYEGVIKTGAIGEIYHVRTAWHRNGSWRRKGDPPSHDFNPSQWGYPTFDHLLNWRLYWKYSQGLMAELCSHQINAVNWFLGSTPEAVVASGGLYRFPEGREVYDHVYATFEYPGGRSVTFSSIESNAFDDYYEMYLGTKGTLILLHESDAMLFDEEASKRSTTIAMSSRDGGAVALSSETMAGHTNTSAASSAATSTQSTGPRPIRIQIQRFCSAIRVGTPIACGPDKAIASARPCIRANEAIKQKTRLVI